MLALEQARHFLARGQWSAARPLLERAVRAEPKSIDAAFLFARTLQMLGEREPAAYHAARCVDLRPADPNIRTAAAELLQAVGKPGEAERLFRAGLTRFPDASSMPAGLINTLRAQGRLGEAGDIALVAAARFERDPLLAIIAAGALGESLRGREAATLVRRAVTLAPGDHRILRAAATMLLYADDATEDELAAVHAAAGRAIAASIPAPASLTSRDLDPASPRRVGLVSPDFRDHAVARFIESWLGRHVRARIEITAISTMGPEDDTTRRLRPACDHWLDISALSDDAAVAAISALHLDAAIDLAGLHVTARPALFARRLAPVQLSWLGYAHATGLPTIDARLADTMTDPSSLNAAGVSTRGGVNNSPSMEPICALDPCFLCFAPDPRTPAIAAGTDSRSERIIRFASFNAQQKITHATLDLWSEVLLAVPDSELVLKSRALVDQGVRRVLDNALQSRGVAPSRALVLPHAPGYADHLICYNDCDIALDTTPYAGTTTTCEAMLMGLPVITLAGERHAARVGASLLQAAGRGDAIASSAAEFIRLAAAAAAELRSRTLPERLAAKQAARAVLLASPLCDATAFAARWQEVVVTLIDRAG